MPDNTADGKAFMFPDRTVERRRGCWNCVGFDNGERAQQHYTSRVDQERSAIIAEATPDMPRLKSDDGSIREVARKAQEFLAQGHSPKDATDMALASVGGYAAEQVRAVQRQDARFQMFGGLSQHGLIGICTRGGSQADFVACTYLCAKWRGREGASVATEGAPLDKLPEELKDEVDGE